MKKRCTSAYVYINVFTLRSGKKYIIFLLLIVHWFISCSKIGEEQSSEDAEDGPPELLVCITFQGCVLRKVVGCQKISTPLKSRALSISLVKI